MSAFPQIKPLIVIPDHALKVMCEAWREMNAIHARDGKPIGSDITQEYWDDIMSRLNAVVKDASGHDAWLHPVLFQKS